MSFAPAIHAGYIVEPRYLPFFRFQVWMLGGALYIFGAVIYAKKFPEKTYPGKFDIFVSNPYFINDSLG